jgi:hypothetical protein
MKAGLSDVLLFVIPFFMFGLKSIFQQSYPFLPMKAGIRVMLLFVIPLFYLHLRLVLSIFNSPALFLTMKRVFNSPTQIYL